MPVAVNIDVDRRSARYVEEKYKIIFGAAQNTQLSRALATGADKGTFVLPKG
jgi:histone H1/5